MFAGKTTHLKIYPVKSFDGYTVDTIIVEPEGPQGDRRWMVVDPSGKFLTQRAEPRMCLVKASYFNNFLVLEVPDSAETKQAFPHLAALKDFCRRICLPKIPQISRIMKARVWDDTIQGQQVCDENVSFWLTQLFEKSLHLIKLDPSAPRLRVSSAQPDAFSVSLADGLPYLIINETSVHHLNSSLNESVPWEAYRPNIVVDLGQAFLEDKATDFHFSSGVSFGPHYTCVRCSMINIRPKSATKRKDVLKSLTAFRKAQELGIDGFGRRAFAKSNGVITLGDKISFEIIS